MTLLAPIWLAAGVVAALGILALHFIARQRPAPMSLPTARFVPDRPARAARRAPRPTDLVLLALRALAVMVLGLAFAGPIWHQSRAPLLRVVLLDRSRAAASDSAARAARAMLRPGDVLVPFDTLPRPVMWDGDDSVPAVRDAPADLAAALLAGMREAASRAASADSLELVIVSPFDASGWSAAVLPIRAEWPGRITIIRAPVVTRPATDPAIAVRGDPDDPLVATVALLGAVGAPASSAVRLVRDGATAADSAWVRDSAGTLLWWPRRSDREAPDSVEQAGTGAVMTHETIAIAPWTRLPLPAGRAIAWWADGTPAAVESAVGAGCLRTVGIGIPEIGDAALATSTQRLVRALSVPCGGAPAPPVVDSLVRQLAGTGPLASAARAGGAGILASAATPWLLLAALGLLIAEWTIRRRVRDE